MVTKPNCINYVSNSNTIKINNNAFNLDCFDDHV